jgi:hypothetical protein
MPAAGQASGPTHDEVAGANAGVNTYSNPYTLAHAGTRIPFLTHVAVSCKVDAPTMPSVTYWYLVQTAPWNEYYAPADSFLNGDPPQGPYNHDLDTTVRDCPPINQSR